ncbi:uncharacterized protein [Arachis hypogaea]|uniref:uncharacterized protein n=1 Tax=Arachis hypogaea TaxID=3818 RepID=UPI003B218295
MLEEVSKDGAGRAAPFNPKPVRLAEYDEWCRPWKLSLIVKVLEDAMQNLAVWVRIPELPPVELYTYHFLWRAGGKIGTMLKIDQTTSIHSRRKFARLCVEVDLRNQLVPAIKVLGKEFKVEYEGLHLICFGCGKYGHRIDGFPESR